MYLIMEAVICYVSDNAGSNMLKKTLSWVMVGMLFLSLVFNENLVTKKIDAAKKVIENIMKNVLKHQHHILQITL